MRSAVGAGSLRTRDVVAVAAALLVLYVVLHALLLHRFPWFVDETFYGVFTQAGADDPSQRFGALMDHKGLVIQWIGMVLVHLDVPPIDALRLVAIASGAAAAGAACVLVQRWWDDRRLALAAAALVAFVPYFFVHDSVGIYDAFVAGGSMVALVLQVELARRPRLDLSLVLGVVLGLLVLAKPTGLLAVVLIPVSLVLMDWRRQHLVRRLATWAGFVLLALAITACLWSLSRLSPLAFTPAPENHRTLGEFFSDPFEQLPRVAPEAWRAMWGYLTPAGVLLGLWGLVRTVATRHWAGIVVAVWALAALAAFLLLTDTAYPRYGLQAVGPICVLMVVGAADLWHRVSPRVRGAAPRARWWALAASVVALAALAPMLVLDARVLLSPGDAPYPGLDRAQYNALVSNRGPVHEAAQEVLRLAPASFTDRTPTKERTVAGLGGWPWATQLTLNGTHYTTKPRFRYVDDTSDHAVVNAARFVIVEGLAPAWLRLRNARLVRRWSRPGGGPPVALYDRGT